jgi:polar amino acid transport system substrate-binding protein
LPLAFAFRRLAALLLALVLALPVAALLPARVSAQQEPEFYDDEPYAPGQWNIGRRVDQSEFRYCVDPRDPSWQVDGEIADAIAQDLLLQPQRYVVPSQIVLEDITKLYAILLEHCDVYMGFKLIPEGYPGWVTLTRAYDEVGYVFVTAKSEIHALADLPPGRPIAATIGTTAHIRLVSYNMAVPAEKRWPTFPYGTNELALQAVHDGSADVALVWGPSFWDKQQHDPAYAAFHIIDSAPLPATKLGVGGLLLQKNTFLRAGIDQAIDALVSDGAIQAILDKYKYPATAKP